MLSVYAASSYAEGGIHNGQRVNITLPEETLQLIDRVTQEGNRSRFVDRVVRYYIGQVGRTNLKQQLKEGALRRAGRDLSLSPITSASLQVFPGDPVHTKAS
jgi:CopG family transcriptional regulator / antitoxin EndoAI